MKAKTKSNEPKPVRDLRMDLERELKNCQEKRTTPTYNFDDEKDVKQIKHMMEKFCAAINKSTRDPRKALYCTQEGRSLIIMNRRKDAAFRLSREAEERYRPKYPNVDIVEMFAKLNLTASYTHIDRVEGGNHVLLAAVKWILDELRGANRYDDALKYIMIDGNQEQMEDVVPNVKFIDYDDDVIRGMAYLVCCRNCSGVKEGKVGRIIDDSAALRRPQNAELQSQAISEMTVRERFDAVMNLIPLRSKKRAERHFEELIWKQFALCLREFGRYRDREIELLDMFIDIIKESQECMKELNGLSERREKRNETLKMFAEQGGSVESMLGAINANAYLYDDEQMELHKGLERMEQLARGREHLHSKVVEAEDIQAFIGMCPMWGPKLMWLGRLGIKTVNAIESLRIKEPYELCFAMLSLVDQDSDLAWLYNLPLCVLRKAVESLPWIVKKGCYENSDKYHKLSSVNENVMYKHLFEMPADVVAGECAGDEFILNISQLIYSLSGVVMPTNIRGVGNIKSTLIQNGVPANEAALWERYVALCCSVGSKVNQESVASPENNTIEMLEQKKSQGVIEELEKEKAKLRAKVTELESKVDSCYTTIREQNKRQKEIADALDKERATVNDLRTKLDMQSDTTMIEEKSKIDFPYTPRKRVLVVGGDVGWVNAMKKYIYGAHFMDADQKIRPSDVMNCELLWVQANVMSHKTYRAAIDVARKNGTRVMYFSFQGAKMCADQIAQEDIKT